MMFQPVESGKISRAVLWFETLSRCCAKEDKLALKRQNTTNLNFTMFIRYVGKRRKYSRIASSIEMARIKKTQSGDNFFNDVHQVAKLIPKGRVTSYGAIANYLGVKSSARMVGWAMHGCPKGVPAHRVVNSAGLLTGKPHFKPPSAMKKALEKEGVKVRKDQVQNFRQVFWDPSKEL